ncbi:fimbrial protein [Serratia sp. 14-2641]|nr:fimbrial protein [Serratia sp. 14-2641]
MKVLQLARVVMVPSMLIAGSLFALSAMAAPTRGWGTIAMEGAIVETACAIDVGSQDQTVDMGVVPLGQIVRDGRGNTRPFTIQLVDCQLSAPTPAAPEWRYFQVTFDGPADRGLFAVNGDSRGIALRITDSRGNVARPGDRMPPGNIVPGSMGLNYFLDVMGNHEVLRAGAYQSTVRFKLNYY